MKIFIVLIQLFLFTNIKCSIKNFENPVHPEAKLPTNKYLEYFKYPYEVHYITTDDGYILKNFRVQAKNTLIKQNLPVIYFHHGMGDTCDGVLVQDEHINAIFILANQGYDVFLGNSRGNTYSRNHTTLNPDKDKEFWKFTYQNMSRYDLPAAFKYITNLTGQQKIDYIGHSEGTMILFIALAEKNPGVEPYLKHIILWGPVIYAHNQYSDIFKFLTQAISYKLIDFFGIEEVQSYKWLQHPLMEKLCAFSPDTCRWFLGLVSEADPRVDNAERMDVLVGHEPGGTSLMNMHHWQQIVLHDGWLMYDYGSVEENQLHYGQDSPPSWDPKMITNQLYLMSGTTDRLADTTDVNQMINDLVNAKVWHKIYEYGHLTFLWGITMEHMKDVVEILKNDIY